jgi:hypothetical protein
MTKTTEQFEKNRTKNLADKIEIRIFAQKTDRNSTEIWHKSKDGYLR